MKKIYFKVYKLKNIAINCCIFLLIGIVALVAFLGEDESLKASTISGVYYNGNVNQKKVSLMVNVYWGNEYINDMLQIFEDNKIKTTFFVGGIWVLENKELLKEIYDNGHEIGNHGYKHKDQDKLSRENAKKEMSITHDLVLKSIQYKMTLFAPPSGAYNEQTVEVATEMGYKTIMWTKDTIDWRDQDVNLIVSRVKNNLKGGDLILLHPTDATVKALPEIIRYISKQGYEITTVSDCIVNF